MPVEPANDGGAGGLIASHDDPQFFRIQPRRQRRRIHHITEHHGELAALAFALGSRSLLDLPRTAFYNWSCNEGHGASCAELRLRQILESAAWTASSQWRGALDAKVGAVRVG